MWWRAASVHLRVMSPRRMPRTLHARETRSAHGRPYKHIFELFNKGGTGTVNKAPSLPTLHPAAPLACAASPAVRTASLAASPCVSQQELEAGMLTLNEKLTDDETTEMLRQAPTLEARRALRSKRRRPARFACHVNTPRCCARRHCRRRR